MIDHDVLDGLDGAALELERVAVLRVGPVQIITRAHTDVLHEYVGALDAQRGAADRDARRRRGLPGNRDVAVADQEVRRDVDVATDFEHAGAWSRAVDTGLQR